MAVIVSSPTRWSFKNKDDEEEGGGNTTLALPYFGVPLLRLLTL